MYTIQEVIQELKKVIKRRKKLLIIIPIFFLGLSIAALYLIEPKYESSISILVEQEENSNILDLYGLDRNNFNRSPNRLEAFQTIIQSRAAMEMLIDSLHLDDSISTIAQKRGLINGLRQSIATSAGEEASSFQITFTSTDPVRARDAAALLADYFIKTRTRFESQRSSETVEFLKNKMAEFEQVVDQQRDEVVSSTTEQMQEVPANPEVLQRRLEDISTQLQELDISIYQEENKLNILESFLNQDESNFSMQPLYRLSLSEIPNGEALTTLLAEYDTLNQKFTESYPSVINTKEQIIEVARRIQPAVQSNVEVLKRQRADVRRERERVMGKMETSFIATQKNSSTKSNYTIYQELYGEIKKRLEQAQLKLQMSSNSGKFMVLDEPVIAENPSSPNKRLILGAGLGLGLFISCLMMGFAEVMDTTVRSEEDLKLNKPIIAYLKDGRE